MAQAQCAVVLVVPPEFATREYVSSFESREFRFQIGPPAMESIDSLLTQSFVNVKRQLATGDGTFDFLRTSSNAISPGVLAARPRFTRLESSVVPGSLNIEVGIALDFAGSADPVTLEGAGKGAAHLYTDKSIKKAADAALSSAIQALARKLPVACGK